MFIAQANGIDLTLGQQFAMRLVLRVTSKGIAGVPRATLVVIAATLARVNLPEAGLLLLLGIGHFLDIARSATNVIGNRMATAVVSKWEGQLRAEGEPVPEDMQQAIAPVTSTDARQRAPVRPIIRLRAHSSMVRAGDS